MITLCLSICSSCMIQICSSDIRLTGDLFILFRSDQLADHVMYPLLAPISIIVIILNHLKFLAMHIYPSLQVNVCHGCYVLKISLQLIECDFC